MLKKFLDFRNSFCWNIKVCIYSFSKTISLLAFQTHWLKCLSRFRCSNHCLEIETGRRAKPLKVPCAERTCKKCSLGAIEDEDHFLLVCPAYDPIRSPFRDLLPLGPVTPVQVLLSNPVLLDLFSSVSILGLCDFHPPNGSLWPEIRALNCK